jgi:hypothetical protein
MNNKQRILDLIGNNDNLDNNQEDDINYANELREKYKDKIDDDYVYINSKNRNKLKLGGCIKYVNKYGEIKSGAILLKILNKNKTYNTTLLLKNPYRMWEIKLRNNYVFFKKNKSKNDKFRELFMSFLDN